MHAALILAFLFVPPDAPPVIPADAPPVIPGFSIAAPDEDYATRAAANIEAAKAALNRPETPESCPCGASCECENCVCPNCPHRKGAATQAVVAAPVSKAAVKTGRTAYYFCASWCGNCGASTPVVTSMVGRGAVIRVCDFDADRELAERLGVTAVPAYVLTVDGKPERVQYGPLAGESAVAAFYGLAVNRTAAATPAAPPAPVASLPAGWHAHQCPSCGIRWTHPDGSTYAGAHSCPSCGRTVTRQSESSPAIRQRSFVPARRSASLFGRMFGACPGGCPR